MSDIDAMLAEARADLDNAVLACERASETLHRAGLVRAIERANRDQLGALFIQHLRCCWDEGINETVRARLRALAQLEAEAMTVDAPF